MQYSAHTAAYLSESNIIIDIIYDTHNISSVYLFYKLLFTLLSVVYQLHQKQ